MQSQRHFRVTWLHHWPHMTQKCPPNMFTPCALHSTGSQFSLCYNYHKRPDCSIGIPITDMDRVRVRIMVRVKVSVTNRFRLRLTAGDCRYCKPYIYGPGCRYCIQEVSNMAIKTHETESFWDAKLQDHHFLLCFPNHLFVDDLRKADAIHTASFARSRVYNHSM